MDYGQFLYLSLMVAGVYLIFGALVLIGRWLVPLYRWLIVWPQQWLVKLFRRFRPAKSEEKPAQKPDTQPPPIVEKPVVTQPATDLPELRKNIEEVRQHADDAARSAAEAVKRELDALAASVEELRKQAATKSALDAVADMFTEKTAELDQQIETLVNERGLLQQQLTSVRNELTELQESLQDEVAAHELVLRTPQSTPGYWRVLEKKWTLLQKNPALRERLLSMWNSPPVQSVGGHFARLLKLSAQQWPRVRQQTDDAPLRLAYWRDLHTYAKRQFVGVSNFFKRLEQLDAKQKFEDGMRGMTRAEFEIGWGHVREPATVGEIPAAQLDGFADVAASKLLETWATPVVRLRHELFVVPRHEYEEPLRSLVLDELETTIDSDGFCSIVEDDVVAAARQLNIDYFSIVPYDHALSEVGGYLNHSGWKKNALDKWLGYPPQLKGQVLLRVEKLALKRRGGSLELIDGGAVVLIGGNANA